MILTVTDDDLSRAVAQLTWIPAHVTAARMSAHPPLTSEGHPMSWRQWRANRLVDIVAKFAASRSRLPPHVMRWMHTADNLHQHQAALLGVVTHAENHLERLVEGPGGTRVVKILRDSAGERPRKPRTWRRYPPQQAAQQPNAASSSSSAAPLVAAGTRPRLGPREKRRKLAEAHAQLDRVRAAKRVAEHIGNLEQRPSSSATSAAERMAALRARVLAREKGDREWQQEQKAVSLWPS